MSFSSRDIPFYTRNVQAMQPIIHRSFQKALNWRHLWLPRLLRILCGHQCRYTARLSPGGWSLICPPDATVNTLSPIWCICLSEYPHLHQSSLKSCDHAEQLLAHPVAPHLAAPTHDFCGCGGLSPPPPPPALSPPVYPHSPLAGDSWGPSYSIEPPCYQQCTPRSAVILAKCTYAGTLFSVDLASCPEA